MLPDWLAANEEVTEAIREHRPVVALESTLIAHGLPWPVNVETAREAEAVIRAAGAIPATIAIRRGTPTAGLSAGQIEELARAEGVMKASRRDLGAAVAGQRLAATTVSATMAIAHAAGIRVFATGGIGGAHRSESGGIESWDISSDLTELGRTPVLVVCAGAKSILDLPRTLEILETLGVPVLGYRTDVFPAFYVRSDPTVPLPVSSRVESAAEAARTFEAHTRLGGGGAVLAQPCPDEVAIPAGEFHAAFEEAQAEASREGISGAKLTPFLLKRIAELTGGRTLAANRALIESNARLAAEVATELSHLGR